MNPSAELLRIGKSAKEWITKTPEERQRQRMVQEMMIDQKNQEIEQIKRSIEYIKSFVSDLELIDAYIANK